MTRRNLSGTIGVEFALSEGRERDVVLRRLFTTDIDNSTHTWAAVRVAPAVVMRVFARTSRMATRPAPLPEPP